MQRIVCPERDDWVATAESAGFDFHTIDGERYWDERAYYAFTLDEIERGIEAPTAEIDAMCLELVGHAIADESYLRRLKIPETFWPLISESWHRDDGSLYGRLDLSFDGSGPAKLLEYNADTPTSIFEAAVFQWTWLEQAIERNIIPKRADQFNSIHECLIEAWKKLGGNNHLHLAGITENAEDAATLAYLEDTASQAGIANHADRHRRHRIARRWPVRRPRRPRHRTRVQALPLGMDVSRRLRREAFERADALDRAAVEGDPSPTRASCRCCGRCFRTIPTCCRPISRTIRMRSEAWHVIRSQAVIFARRRQYRAGQRRHHADGAGRPLWRGRVHPAGLGAAAELLRSVCRAGKLAGRPRARAACRSARTKIRSPATRRGSCRTRSCN